MSKGTSVITASIVGATGYTGAVLTDILAEHPDVQLGALTSKSYVGAARGPGLSPPAGRRCVYARTLPRRAGAPMSPSSATRMPRRMPWWPSCVDRGCRVVDLSADYRLKDPAGLRDLVRVRASASRPGRRGGLRSAGDVPGGDREGPHRREPGVLSHEHAPGTCYRLRATSTRAVSSSTRSRGSRARAALRRRRPTSAPSTRTSAPTARWATGTPPRWCRSWRWPRVLRFPCRSPRICCRWTGGSSAPCTSDPLERSGGQRRLAGEVSRLLQGRALCGGERPGPQPGRGGRAPTSAGITVREDERGRSGEGIQCHRQPGQGCVGAGGAEHEHHVRVCRRRRV